MDPFAGMGTTLFTAAVEGVPAIGLDKMPLATFVARANQEFLALRAGSLSEAFQTLRRRTPKADLAPIADDVPLMSIAFNAETLRTLRRMKTAIDELPSQVRNPMLLLFFAILEGCSFTSKDGQFLRLLRDRKPAEPLDALESKVRQAEEDVQRIQWLFPGSRNGFHPLPRVLDGDTRELSCLDIERKPTAIITSPPYVNRYDYTRSYCVELCFHFVRSFEELKAIRFGILRSHIESKVSDSERPAHPLLESVVKKLERKQLNNPRIPHMIVAYFNDMTKVLASWKKTLASGAKVAMVVDNVRFEGEHIPVDCVLSDIAEDYGFETKEIIVARYKGNSSQQMGKYGRFPVRESILVWQKSA